MNRRSFLQSILIAGVAPAIVRAESLMVTTGFIIPAREIILPSEKLIVPTMARGSRILTVAANSLAFLETQAEGLIPLRKHTDRYGNEMVDFELARTEPRYTRKEVWSCNSP